ncbi:MAG: hypothetical protein ABFE13_06300 [Phycisphaerales bacterium]
MNEYTLWGKLEKIRKGPTPVTLSQLLPIVQDAIPTGYQASMDWGADDERALVVCAPRDPPYCYGEQVGRIFGDANTAFDRNVAERMVEKLLREVNVVEDNHENFRFHHPGVTQWSDLSDVQRPHASGANNARTVPETKSDLFVSLIRIFIVCGTVLGVCAIANHFLPHV